MDFSYFSTLADYNRWANRRLYQACAEVGEDEIARGRPSFFGSIPGTLNHILVADRIWVARIEGRRDDEITSLDQILHDDFVVLRLAREGFDDHIARLVNGLSGDPTRPFSYHNVKGESCTLPLNHVLGHIFNHQTHHRGQVHDMLAQTMVPPPPLDLAYFLLERQSVNA